MLKRSGAGEREKPESLVEAGGGAADDALNRCGAAPLRGG
jgi:hypothetical protein